MHPHEQLLRQMDEAMIGGDMDGFWSVFTDDVVVHAAGRSTLAGTYKGKQQLQELFGRFIERAGEYTFEPHDYLANDEHGIGLQRSHYRRGGQTLDVNDIFLFHFRDGKVSEMWMMSEDEAGFDAFIG